MVSGLPSGCRAAFQRLEKQCEGQGKALAVLNRNGADLMRKDPEDVYCDTIVLKIASRCNLNCSYCYVYNRGNRSWEKKPAVISHDCIDAVSERIREHCNQHSLASFAVILHGGEPLLVGLRKLDYIFKTLRNAAPDHTRLHLAIQTNAVLIDEDICSLFAKYDVSVGVSIDGTELAHDEARVDKFGAGSYMATLSGWRLLQLRGLNPSLLCVIDRTIAPESVYEHILNLNPRKADFLLPDVNHMSDDAPEYLFDSRLGDWLVSLFDIWSSDGYRFKISLFNYIINRVLGGSPKTDALGPDPNHVLVVETDGAIEPLDVLKICGDDFTLTHLNVGRHSLNDAFTNDIIGLYYNSGSHLCSTCSSCEISEICGGGYLPHRYNSSRLFANPSIHCLTLSRIICHLQAHVLSKLPGEMIAKYSLQLASHENTIALAATHEFGFLQIDPCNEMGDFGRMSMRASELDAAR
jgi:uncharacterized protein